MASALQERASQILDRFHSTARKPIVLEFAGTPKAGKTSTIGQIQTFLKRCGFRVKVVVERASVCPIRDKKHANFNVWTACTTLAQILENTQEPPGIEDPQVLILDRGLFDAICWLTMMDRLSRLQTKDRDTIEKFLLADDWRKRITGVILMTASPEDALKREQGYLPVETSGSIMNEEVLAKILATTEECAMRLNDQFRIRRVDTSGKDKDGPRKTAEEVAGIVLDLIEEQLEEKILYIRRSLIADMFSGRSTLARDEGAELLREFREGGRFGKRDQVEDDAKAVQALPVVVVRNKTGDVLRLRRREKDEKSKLHEQLVIWAGGHVREEDGTNGDAILKGAQRELQEELRLSVEADELNFLGAVYADAGGREGKHVCLVFEWRAETDDVAITLSTAEFFERRGTSLSGKFIPLEQLGNEIASGNMKEPWSAEIVRKLLPMTDQKPLSLF